MYSFAIICVYVFVLPIQTDYVYLRSIYIFNNTLIIAVLAVALFKIQKLLNEMPQAG